ncbi:MAG TPA: polysaccharide biosynthesis C-terminal domain-containing protein, partial [Caulobacteraceae bacterium]|nr:polysaccharide biosynthesis C-terminal domain-containing protein [Caulobacteraceae bacterium]
QARFWAAQTDEAARASHFATLYRAFALLAAVFVPVCAVGLWLWPADMGLKFAVAAGLSAILARSLVRLVQERRRAAGEVGGAARLDMGQSAGGFALGAAFAALGLGGAAPLLGLSAAALLLMPFALPKELRQARGGRLELSRLKTYAGFGFPVSAAMILALLLATSDRFLIALFLDEASVGAYHAAYSLSNRTLDVIFLWLGAAGGPALVMALERGGQAALREAAREQVSTMLLIGLPAAAGVALVARPLAEVMVGEGLREAAATVTPWIALAALFSGLTTHYLLQAFTLGRRTKLLLAASCAPVIANIALNIVLIPRFGLIGAAWATASTYGLAALAYWLLGRRAIALPLPAATLLKGLTATGVMALAVLAVPAVGGLVELAAKATAGGIVYAAAALALDVAGVRAPASRILKAVHARWAT